jgi:hypothetical protein
MRVPRYEAGILATQFQQRRGEVICRGARDDASDLRPARVRYGIDPVFQQFRTRFRIAVYHVDNVGIDVRATR